MANGISAIEGFTYQAAASLELTLGHFKRFPDGVARPEGNDDLELRRMLGARESLLVQIKKPRATVDGLLTGKPWTLADMCSDLLSKSFRRLRGTGDQQLWVLGDELDERCRQLIQAGAAAPRQAAAEFASAVRHLVRAGLKLEEVTAELPGVLDRIQACEPFGAEAEVEERCARQLQEHWHLQDDVIRQTLLPNLRSYVFDIAKQRNRWINRVDLEVELRRTWPPMVLARQPPLIRGDHLRRPSLVGQILGQETYVDVVGVSGSGKTLLAGELLERLGTDDIGIYIEIQAQADFRDALTGIAYVLRRYEVNEPFRVVTKPRAAHEDVLSDVADALRGLKRRCVIVLDYKRGTSSDEFCQDLAAFARRIPAAVPIQMIALGQEPAYRYLSAADRERLKVRVLPAPGFQFEELVELSSLLGGRFSRGRLSEVYRRLTAMRPSGLLPVMAYELLASASGDEALARIASSSEVLREAERARYKRWPREVKAVAQRVACIVLPFSAQDAVRMFPGEQVQYGLAHLQREGILRMRPDGLLEMHETVRRGFEQIGALKNRVKTHRRLAQTYGPDQAPAKVFHLGQAGDVAKANTLARECVVSGQHLSSLATFAVERNLLSNEEICELFATNPKDLYALARALQRRKRPGLGKALLERFLSKAMWESMALGRTIHLVATMLFQDPETLSLLIESAIEADLEDNSEELSRVARVVLAANRVALPSTEDLLPHFERARGRRKDSWAAVLLLRPTETVLRAVLAYCAERFLPLQPAALFRSEGPVLRLESDEEADGFIRALPAVEMPALVIGGAALEPFASFIAHHKERLRRRALALLADATNSAEVLLKAARVACLLGEERAIDATATWRTVADPRGDVAMVVPLLLRARGRLGEFINVVTDRSIPLDARSASLLVVAGLGGDLGSLLRWADEHDPGNVVSFRRLLLMSSLLNPSAALAPVLEAELSRLPSDRVATLLMALSSTGRNAQVTSCLIAALVHPKVVVRRAAAVGLQVRRAPAALEPLRAAIRRERDHGTRKAIAKAAVCSGPLAMADLDGVWEGQVPDVWRVVAAGRTGARELGPYLVRTATDAEVPWQLRRAALLAIGRLRDPGLAANAAPPVLREQLSLKDDSVPLHGYTRLLALCSPSDRAWLRELERNLEAGPEAFTSFVRAYYVEIKTEGMPTAEAAADWLWNRLTALAPREFGSRIAVINDELHLPIVQAGALAALRKTGLKAEVEACAVGGYPWLRLRALQHRSKMSNWDSRAAERVQGGFTHGIRLQRVFEEYAPRALALVVAAPVQPEPPKAIVELSGEDVIRALKSRGALPDGDLLRAEGQHQELMQLLDPRHDSFHVVVSQEPPTVHPGAEDGGFFVHEGKTLRSEDNASKSRKKLRALLAAAWPLEEPPLAWHTRGLSQHEYARHYLKAMAVAGRADLLRQELGTTHLVEIIEPHEWREARPLLDARVIPILARLAPGGTDRSFFSTCAMAAQSDGPGIVEVLTDLLSRWIRLYRSGFWDPAEPQNLSRALSDLVGHPRFRDVPAWETRLGVLLQRPMYPGIRQTLLRAIRSSPASYARIEEFLLQEAPFEHFREDSVADLDETAQGLFSRSLE